jgi:curved DNA-binding protein CbpA
VFWKDALLDMLTRFGVRRLVTVAINHQIRACIETTCGKNACERNDDLGSAGLVSPVACPAGDDDRPVRECAASALCYGLVEYDSYYELLGVGRGASQEEIKRRYRTVAGLMHPDRGGDTSLMAVINKAYEILSDPQRRAAYDAYLRSDRPTTSVRVDPLIGLRLDHVWAYAYGKGVGVHWEFATDPSKPNMVVLAQHPQPGQAVTDGTIDVVVNALPNTVDVLKAITKELGARFFKAAGAVVSEIAASFNEWDDRRAVQRAERQRQELVAAAERERKELAAAKARVVHPYHFGGALATIVIVTALFMFLAVANAFSDPVSLWWVPALLAAAVVGVRVVAKRRREEMAKYAIERPEPDYVTTIRNYARRLWATHLCRATFGVGPWSPQRDDPAPPAVIARTTSRWRP